MSFTLLAAIPSGPVGPFSIERWYDRATRVWVIQCKDVNGTQVGNAVYAHSKREANTVTLADFPLPTKAKL